MVWRFLSLYIDYYTLYCRGYILCYYSTQTMNPTNRPDLINLVNRKIREESWNFANFLVQFVTYLVVPASACIRGIRDWFVAVSWSSHEWMWSCPNELRIPTNDYESITIQLRCLRMHYEFVTNYVRFFWNREFVANILNSSKLLPRFPDHSRLERTDYEYIRIS